jgi:predicted enzyme involved in methoxymalonyl-ACP biosynthesis
LLLSCRVLGRTVETAFLSVIASQARMDGACAIVGEFLPTARNGPARGLYEDHGFQPLDELGQLWRLDLTGNSPAVPDYITIVTEMAMVVQPRESL